MVDEGGPGSGAWGHKGIKGKRGGSLPGSGGEVGTALRCASSTITAARNLEAKKNRMYEADEDPTTRQLKSLHKSAVQLRKKRNTTAKLYKKMKPYGKPKQHARDRLEDAWAAANSALHSVNRTFKLYDMPQMSFYVEQMVDEARGKGKGVGGKRQGDGGATWDKCPECGYKTKHTKGTPANTKKCPKCGANLVGESTTEAKTFKCPECGTKVLTATGYCVKCKKKVAREQVGEVVASDGNYYDLTPEQKQKWLQKQLNSKRANALVAVAKKIKHSGEGMLFWDPQYDSVQWIASQKDYDSKTTTAPSDIPAMFMSADKLLKSVSVEVRKDRIPTTGPWVQLYPTRKVPVPEKRLSITMYREKKKTATEADMRSDATYKSHAQKTEDANSKWECVSCGYKEVWKSGVVKTCPMCGHIMERKLCAEFTIVPQHRKDAMEQRSDFPVSSTAVATEAQKLGVIDKPLSKEDQKIADMDPGERMRLDVLVLSMFERKKKPPKDYVSAVESEYKMRAKAKEKLSTDEKKIARGLKKHGVKVPESIL